MNAAPRICAIILAAGASSRMGFDKAILPWPAPPPGNEWSNGTILSAEILALKPFSEAVIVVAGRNGHILFPIAARHGASIAVNPDPGRGQFSSMQIGLRAVLDCGCDAAMITPVDCPPLSAASLSLLSKTFASALPRGKWAVAPQSAGKRGHPLLMNRELIEAFLAAPVTSNAREVKRVHEERFEYVPVPDPFLSADMNTVEEYASIFAQIQRPES
jgi:CTP:molybdopterin cytidylyltransferase MocA